MATRPKRAPTWATDSNFTNGPDAGTPTRVAPISAKRAEGFIPAEQPPAQYFNDALGLIGDWLEYLKGMDWLNWTLNKMSVTSPSVDAASAMYFIAHSDTNYSLGVLANGKAVITYDGANWKQVGNTGVTNPPTTAGHALFYSKLFGIWVYGDNGTGGGSRIATSANGGVTWTARTDPSATRAIHNCFAEGAGVIVSARSAAGFLTSPDGVTWTERTNPLAFKYMMGVAWNGSVFAAVEGSGVRCTSPDGITWTDRGNPNAIGSASDLIYSVALGLFIIMCDVSYHVETSADGITWTAAAANSIPTLTPVTSLADNNGTLYAYDGTHHLGSNGVTQIARSLNGGASWETQILTSAINAVPDYRTLSYGNGRLWIAGKDETGNAAVLTGLRVGS